MARIEPVQFEFRADGKEIYVDAVGGSDTASGEVGNPIQTLGELIQRVPPAGDVDVYLAAGTYELPDNSGTNGWNVLTAETLRMYGTVTVTDSFTVDSVTDNIITAQGSPGWTVDEHVDKYLRWTSGIYRYSWRVLSNTANTLTVTLSTSDIGGSTPKPTNGETIDFGVRASIISNPSTDSSSQSGLYVRGFISFFDIRFSGAVNAGSIGVGSWDKTAQILAFWCELDNYSFTPFTVFGTLTMYGCDVRDSYIGVNANVGSQVTNLFDTTFKNITASALKFDGTSGFLASSTYGWYENVQNVGEFQDGATVQDFGAGFYLDDVDYVIRMDGNAHYQHDETTCFNGFDAAHRDANIAVVYSSRRHNTVRLQGTPEIGPTATFFRMDGVDYSYTDYVANGKNAEFPGNTRVIG